MKIVLCGVLCENGEHKQQLLDGFKDEFGVDFEILGSYLTLPGHGGEGGRNDVVMEMPDEVVLRAAIHRWHLSGLFRWYDDFLNGSRDIVPEEAYEKFFKEEESESRELSGPCPKAV